MSFIPSRSAISDITQANPAVVTTATPHNLTTGQIVRIHVPKNYGMSELNQLALSITVLSSNTFSLQYSLIPPGFNVNSKNFTAFTTPSNPRFTAEVLAIGAGPVPITEPAVYTLNNTCYDLVEDAIYNNSTSPIPFNQG